MAYLQQEDTSILTDLQKRKEFYHARTRDIGTNIIPNFALDEYKNKGYTLQLHNYQLFVSNFINPDTPYKRLLLKWDTGTGKSIGALSIAMNFIKINYHKSQIKEPTGSVFIIGFNDTVFKNELLRFPQFGFISHSEKNRIIELNNLISRGLTSYRDTLSDLISKIKRRFSNRKKYGYFQFIGYKALVNRLFTTDINKLNHKTEDQVFEMIKSGELNINQSFLNEFKNSLIICDEIHNVYNSMEKNNWGISLQVILNSTKDCRSIFMSATPINNKPNEIVDLINLLDPINKYKKSDFFDKNDNIVKKSLSKLAKIVTGRVSYLRNVDPKYYPARYFVGETVPGITELKFIRCIMSPFHYSTYKKVYTGVISQDSKAINDMLFPNPKDPKGGGMYQSSIIKMNLMSASQSWKDKFGLRLENNMILGDITKLKNIRKYSTKYAKMIEDLHYGLKNDWGKTLIYHNIVHMTGVLFIEEILRNNGFIGEKDASISTTLCSLCGKPKHTHKKFGGGMPGTRVGDFTYIEWGELDIKDPKVFDGIPTPTVMTVKNSHKDFISQLMRNKFIQIGKYEQYSLWSNSDMDAKLVAKRLKSYYGNKKTIIYGGSAHAFKPARYIIVHSEIDRGIINYSIDRFNSINNMNGETFKILIGSRVIRESFNFKSVRRLFIMSRPDNIPTFIQIIGRARRNKSHIDLPIEKQTIHVHIYVHSMRDSKLLSHEEDKYKQKLKTYKVIQTIEKVLHQNAIDSLINRPKIVMGNVEDSLAPIKFDPAITDKKYNMGSLNLFTFDAYHSLKEVSEIAIIIKRLFVQISPVWSYGDLWKVCRNPPFYTEIDTTLFEEDRFIVALSNLVKYPSHSREVKHVEPIHKTISRQIPIDMLFDPSEFLIIIPNGQKCIISQTGMYYILCPLDAYNEPILDIESVFRLNRSGDKRKINLQSYLKNSRDEVDYESQKTIFRKKYQTAILSELESAVCDFTIEFHEKFIEDIISYIFNYWTKVVPESTFHNFYIKMLYYYDILGIIIWAHTTKKSIKKLYEKYLDKPNIKELGDEGIINLLKSNISKRGEDWCPINTKNKFEQQLQSALKSMKNKNKNVSKVPANLLPIGYFLSDWPKFYSPETNKWNESHEYSMDNHGYIENNIIIGYDDRSKMGMHIRFKIRSPIQNITKFKDSRMIEKGSICKSKSKQYLIDVARKLKITLNDEKKPNVISICSLIRAKLIHNEIQERTKGSDIKWFYFFFESRPELK